MQNNDHDSSRRRPEHDQGDGGETAEPADWIDPLSVQRTLLEAEATSGDIVPAKNEVEESLSDALSDLEQILQRHEGTDPGTGSRDDAGTGMADKRRHHSGARSDNTTTDDKDTEQYVIPLLDDVVIPGTEGHAPPPLASTAEAPLIEVEDDEPALRRRLAERLASEIDIITQHCMEAALETARAEIRVQVRNHLDIILPEIVEELNQLRRRSNDDLD